MCVCSSFVSIFFFVLSSKCLLLVFISCYRFILYLNVQWINFLLVIIYVYLLSFENVPLRGIKAGVTRNQKQSASLTRYLAPWLSPTREVIRDVIAFETTTTKPKTAVELSKHDRSSSVWGGIVRPPPRALTYLKFVIVHYKRLGRGQRGRNWALARYAGSPCTREHVLRKCHREWIVFQHFVYQMHRLK